MDKEKLGRIIEIVRKMNAEGVSQTEIKEDLKAIGLNGDEIEQVMASAKTEPTQRDIHEHVKKIREKVEKEEFMKPAIKSFEDFKKTGEEIKEKVSEIHGGVTEQAEKINKMEKVLKEHKKKIEETHDVVKVLGKEPAKTTRGTSFITSDIGEIKEMLIEMRPMIKALHDLNKKIIQTNRELLLELKKKK